MAKTGCWWLMRMRENDGAWRREFPSEWRCFRAPDPWHLLMSCDWCDVLEAHDLWFHFVPQTLNHQRMCLSYGPPWAHYLGGYQDRLLDGPLGLPGLRYTAPDGVEHKDYGGEVLG
jgi:hypothetical protein